MVGGLVGINDKSKISESYSSGVVLGKAGAVGGLVGENCEGEINNSYSTGTVTAEDWGAGGLVGQNNRNSKISNSYSTGLVTANAGTVGGLVGANGGDISNSYSTGIVKGSEFVGGFVGQNYVFGLTANDIYAGTIVNSYSTGKVMGGIYLPNGFVQIRRVNGLVGDNQEDSKVINSYYDSQTSDQGINVLVKDKGDGKTTVQMKQKSSFKSWDFNKTWGINSKINNGYPYLLENKP